ncbi:MAG: Hpt domain-containing protein [Pseudanabaenaceae cyanobacterium]
MDQDKQRQITVYFIEEAKDHLHTIESGLLNLESMLQDAEMVNELFRAAHSIKGGAAMLGLTSIQHLAHKLEDYFKVFKENNNLKADQQLQTLFLEGFDRLKDLIERLDSPEGLTRDVADSIVRESEPVFDQLQRHLNMIMGGTKPQPVATAAPAPATVTPPAQSDRNLIQVFQMDVPAKLRDMLNCFKQPDTPKNRENLQALCDQLQAIGDRFYLTQWSDLLQAIRAVLGRPDLEFRLLAPLAIREIKQAQELVLAGKADTIQISPQVKKVLPAGVVLGEERRQQQWQAFIQQIGWSMPAAVNYDLTAVEGHLPAPIWFEAWQANQPQQMRSLYEAFCQKLGDCEIN